jgi:hypothetical protein
MGGSGEVVNLGGVYVWKSATVAWSPWGRGMNSCPAPLMTVRGTSLLDTVNQLAFSYAKIHFGSRMRLTFGDVECSKVCGK